MLAPTALLLSTAFSVLLSFFTALTKIPGRSNLRKEGIVLTHGMTGYSASWEQQEHEVAIHGASAARQQRHMNVRVQLSFFFSFC